MGGDDGEAGRPPLNPGTDDAETFPASGDCAIDSAGSIGTPYTTGSADKTPPCGIACLHATDGKPYQLKASITWQISWEGSGGVKGDLPDGTFHTTQSMAVQEIHRTPLLLPRENSRQDLGGLTKYCKGQEKLRISIINSP